MADRIADVVARWRLQLFLAGMYGSAWLVGRGVVPASLQSTVTVVLVALGMGLLAAGVWLRYGELSPGRCRARTSTGERCSRDDNLGGDCCWQHAELHDVTLVEEEDRMRGSP